MAEAAWLEHGGSEGLWTEVLECVFQNLYSLPFLSCLGWLCDEG